MNTLQRRTIYFVWTYREWGGAQIYFLAIMKAAKSDWNIVVLLPRESMPEITRYLDKLGIDYRPLDCLLDNDPGPTLFRKLQRQWRRIHAQATTYRQLSGLDLKNNILHIELAPWQDWLMILFLVMRGANVFATMHNFPPHVSALRSSIWKLRFRIVSRLSGFHLFTSNVDTKNRLRGWVSESFWQGIRVTYTAVDPAQIEAARARPLDRGAIRSRHSIAPEDLVVLCVGQFIDRKGRWVFLDAAREVVRSCSDVSFVWLAPEMPSGEDQARIDGFTELASRFHLISSGSVGEDRIDILSFFLMADIFALPSYVEGLPIALLEAMALGLPCVSTNVYAIPEAIRDGETGLLVERGDPRALAKAILALRDDRDLRLRLGEKGREHVLNQFDERTAAACAIQAYREALNDGG
jgi:glycosyltransferase involved in cell wall biosynthesis